MIIVIGLYLLILLVAIYIVIQSKSNDNYTSKAHPTSFIIPFKNEAKRIELLVQSLNQSDWSNYFEIIFVDDHSTDSTIDHILETLDVPFKLVKLKETIGKKMAIAYGVQKASHQSIHTLDADVAFEPDYLNSICSLPNSDLTILPVQLSGTRLFQQLNAIEFQWLQTFTFALAKLKQPTLCNGANLTFSRSAFLASLESRTDFNQASGDDTFLLTAIRKSKGKINAFNYSKFNVRTEAPITFKGLISQRKRWIKKVLNLPAILILSIYAIYHLFPIYGLINLRVSLLWLLPLVLKIIAEWILSRQLTIKQLFFIILHQIYYPVYGLVLLISLPFKSIWK